MIFDDKLKEIYNALFVISYSNDIQCIRIGNYTFDENTKKILLETVSLLSQYTNFYNDAEEN